MKESRSPRGLHIECIDDTSQKTQRPAAQPENRAASFDTTTPDKLGDLKRLQDPAMFGRARFSFKLYKR